MRVVETLYQAISQALPERVPAGSKGMICHVGFGGRNPRDGELFAFLETVAGGFGGRASTDGPDAVQPHPQNTENAPVEETEINYPVRILRYEMIEESEGPGTHRGGLGLRRDYTFEDDVSFTILADRDKWGPSGLFGGRAANPARYILNPDTDPTVVSSKTTLALHAGDVISIQSCGGGGYGPPEARDPGGGPQGRARRADLGRARGRRLSRGRGPRERHRGRGGHGGPARGIALVGHRLGVDIGGTFTDAILIDEETGEFRISKVSSTPTDPSEGFLHATDRILASAGADPGSLRYVVHGTTVATNAIIQRRIARTALITTDGFRDVLEIGRQIRPSLYDIQFEKPVPLVPRYLSFGVPERLDWHGDVLLPLDEAAVREVAGTLREQGVESVAVCLIHAYANPVHEVRIGEILAEELPGRRGLAVIARSSPSSASTIGPARSSSTPASSLSSRSTSARSRTGCGRGAWAPNCW